MNIIPLHAAPIRLLRPLKMTQSRLEVAVHKIGFSTREGLYIVDISSIVHCVAMDNYCQVFRKDGNPITIAKTLKSVDAILGMNGFLRVHQSHLVSVREITFVGQDFILLSNGKRVPISRSKRSIVIEQLISKIKMAE